MMIPRNVRSGYYFVRGLFIILARILKRFLTKLFRYPPVGFIGWTILVIVAGKLILYHAEKPNHYSDQSLTKNANMLGDVTLQSGNYIIHIEDSVPFALEMNGAEKISEHVNGTTGENRKYVINQAVVVEKGIVTLHIIGNPEVTIISQTDTSDYTYTGNKDVEGLVWSIVSLVWILGCFGIFLLYFAD
jgi:hypothetical protein